MSSWFAGSGNIAGSSATWPVSARDRRKREAECRSRSRRAREPDPAAMRLYDSFCDREPETRAVPMRSTPLPKPVEHVSLVFGRNPHAGIGDGEHDLAVARGG